MKNKIIFRMVIDISLIVCVILSSIAGIMSLYNAYNRFVLCKITGVRGEEFGWAIHNTIAGIAQILCAVISVVFFIVLNFKDIQWLCGSLAKEIKEHKEATAEERKQKKIDDLQKQLDELKKE